MTEWWTYGLSDFLMFSPQAYWRMVGRHNDAWWPAQLAGLVSAFALVVMLRESAGWAQRIVLGLLAAAWAWLGWSFYWLRYSEIFLAAPALAQACAAQVVMLVTAAALPVPPQRQVRGRTRLAATTAGAAALAYPLLAWCTDHRWNEAEVFAFMPAPTALATLAALLGAPRQTGWERCLLAVLPLSFLALEAVTRWLLA